MYGGGRGKPPTGRSTKYRKPKKAQALTEEGPDKEGDRGVAVYRDPRHPRRSGPDEVDNNAVTTYVNRWHQRRSTRPTWPPKMPAQATTGGVPQSGKWQHSKIEGHPR